MNPVKGILAGCLATLLLAAIGCSDKNRVPSGILSREKMENVLWDMIQADQYSALYLAKDSARIDKKMENLRLYEQVFRLHQVSRDEFRKSYQYYLDHPELNQLLFDSLISRGNRLRTENYSRPAPFHPHPATPPTPSHLPVLPILPMSSSARHSLLLKARDSAAKSHLHPAKRDPAAKGSPAKKDTVEKGPGAKTNAAGKSSEAGGSSFRRDSAGKSSSARRARPAP